MLRTMIQVWARITESRLMPLRFAQEEVTSDCGHEKDKR
jgi:hypothetical protein